MSYYKSTSLRQKVEKLVQLYWLFWKARFTRTPRPVSHPNTSVLMVVPQADRTGGYERQALQLAAFVTRQGHLAHVLTDRSNGLPARELRSGFVIFRIPSRLLACFLFLIRYRRRFQVLHAHGVTGFSLLAIRMARWLGKPVVLKPATQGDLSGLYSRKSLKRRLYRDWIARADCLIAISEEIKKEMLSAGIAENRIRRISNFVDASRFVPPSAERRAGLRQRFGISGNEMVFLYLGRLEERKGVEILLRAWRIGPGGRLWIVGSGPEEQELKALSKELNLSDVVFHGATDAPPDFFQCADLFVLPSLREGAPNVLLEAMSCGLPCVASRIGGVVDVMKDDAEGLLTLPGSAEALAEALEYAASHSAHRERWGAQAVRTVRERFDISRIGACYVDLYSELLAGRLS